MEATKIRTMFRRLQKREPEPTTELKYSSDFQLLVAVMLSAQCTDVAVNKATRTLFAKAPTANKMLALGIKGIEKHIRSIGLYRTKGQEPAFLL